jgi:Leucine-rich repeat (LRR) protein
VLRPSGTATLSPPCYNPRLRRMTLAWRGITLQPMTHQGLRTAQRRIATMDSSKSLDLTGLNLSDQDLLTLQAALGALTSLTELHLSGNQLSTLPESFGGLTTLVRLELGGNQLSALPGSFADLTSLTELYLECSRFY